LPGTSLHPVPGAFGPRGQNEKRFMNCPEYKTLSIAPQGQSFGQTYYIFVFGKPSIKSFPQDSPML
jgi:hypothetical protein